MAYYGPVQPPGLRPNNADGGTEQTSGTASDEGERANTECGGIVIGPALPVGFSRPALPELSARKRPDPVSREVIGPVMPWSSGISGGESVDGTDKDKVMSDRAEYPTAMLPSVSYPIGPALPFRTSDMARKSVNNPGIPLQSLESPVPMEGEKNLLVSGPSLPPGSTRPVAGPQRPPDMTCQPQDRRVMGPTLPSSVVLSSPIDPEEDDDGIVGPSLSLMASSSAYSAVDEVADRFARKAEKLKKSLEPVVQERESWMTDLPESLLGRNIIPKAALTGARTFKRKTDEYEADFSGWTSGPGGHQQPRKDLEKDSLELLQYEQALQRERKLELEIEANNKQKRGEALVTMVQKTKTPEELKERRPFDREKDLNIRKTIKMDQDGVAKRAAELKEKFATSAKAGQKFL